MTVGRFAPSTTGEAHPGTLLAALIAWLAAKSVGGRCLLRLEDLDPIRSTHHWVEKMVQDLTWLGLRFDDVVLQSKLAHNHEAALNQLADTGLLYACGCSRAHIARHGRLLANGTRIYGNTCRKLGRLTARAWREHEGPLRCQLDGVDSDPVVRRRDGSTAYLLACVVDDASMGVTDIVRGRDLAHEEVVQRALGQVLGLPIPSYRHHLLLLERHGGKLAKMHGSLPISKLQALGPRELWVGALAHIAGLQPDATPTGPEALVGRFQWHALREANCVVTLEGDRLKF